MRMMCFCWFCSLLVLSILNKAHTQDSFTMENVALGKTCNMTSTYHSFDFNDSNNCSTAINGNTETVYALGNCIHTAVNDVNPSWTVDLGQNFTIQRITIYGRTGNEHRMKNLQVFVDTTVVFTFPLTEQPQNITEITPLSNSSQRRSNLPMRGRYVTLARLRGSGGYDRYLINVCEVQVWVCKSGYYGSICEQCRPACASSPCDELTFPNTCPAYSPCDDKPCRNSGTCLRLTGSNPYSYACFCPVGYIGTHCEGDIDECFNNPCGNGTCHNSVGSYSCNCTSGFTGHDCMTDIDECLNNPCENETCHNTVGSYWCSCTSGFPGHNCMTILPVDENSSPERRESLTAPLVGGLLGAGLVIVSYIAYIFCWYKRRASGVAKHSVVERPVSELHYVNDPNDSGTSEQQRVKSLETKVNADNVYEDVSENVYTIPSEDTSHRTSEHVYRTFSCKESV